MQWIPGSTYGHCSYQDAHPFTGHVDTCNHDNGMWPIYLPYGAGCQCGNDRGDAGCDDTRDAICPPTYAAEPEYPDHYGSCGCYFPDPTGSEEVGFEVPGGVLFQDSCNAHMGMTATCVPFGPGCQCGNELGERGCGHIRGGICGNPPYQLW